MSENQKRSNTITWLLFALTLLAIVGFIFNYGRRQTATMNKLSANDVEIGERITQLQSQFNEITPQINKIASLPAVTVKSKRPEANTPATRPSAVDEARWKEMQGRVEQQQKELRETQAAVEKTRSDLEGNLNSTRDDLNGAIAKTHEELVALERRGERNYFEFDLSKGKQFQRWGPVMLSLRKADTGHQHLDLAMIVNDNELTKKDLNLYEPVWIYDTGDPRPVQIVVNKINKDRVHGYVSTPKDTQAMLDPGSSKLHPSPP